MKTSQISLARKNIELIEASVNDDIKVAKELVSSGANAYNLAYAMACVHHSIRCESFFKDLIIAGGESR